jgi:nicotinate phosphoribosyltransferase
LIDTYDTEAGARKVVGLAPRLSEAGITLAGVRLDSGDLAAHARKVRRILDDGGLADVRIFASGGINEDEIVRIVQAGAPIDGYGVGTSLVTSQDAPALDCAYKMQEYAGVARRKHSEGKATWPGRKQVFRRRTADGRMAGDVLTVVGDDREGEPLIRPVMRAGTTVAPLPSLAEIRTHAAAELERLPEHLARLQTEPIYPVEVAPALRRLADAADRRLAAE